MFIEYPAIDIGATLVAALFDTFADFSKLSA